MVEKPAKEETVVENATPDYAAGLVSTQVGLPCSAAVGVLYTTSSCRHSQNNVLDLVLIATKIYSVKVCVYMCADVCACMNMYVC